ncbi:MAG TPA: sugar phosphate isomerase/epimerase [Pirellulaceae bacterium]|jgi:sugar phosphate isomerase/epimerase|nr:sugar phosphate isomerase/epimerase [Pirellulaceae bacterium]
MNLAISNIAWPADLDDEALALLPQAGFAGLEIAPTKLWSAPTEVGSSTLREYRRKVEGLGLRVVALQSLLFAKPELQIFGDAGARHATAEYLKRMTAVATELGARSLVFGSPRNRNRGELSKEAADEIAARFFRGVGDAADAHGVRIGIEANPPDYGADYLTCATEAIDFVRELDHPGVRLHLCAGCMQLAGDDAAEAVRKGSDLLVHVHVSEPMLASVANGASQHAVFASALREVGYSGWTSIEMKTPERFAFEDLIASLDFTREVYGSSGDATP